MPLGAKVVDGVKAALASGGRSGLSDGCVVGRELAGAAAEALEDGIVATVLHEANDYYNEVSAPVSIWGRVDFPSLLSPAATSNRLCRMRTCLLR